MEHAMESYVCSIPRHSQYIGVTPSGSVDANDNSYGENDDMDSDSGSIHGTLSALHYDVHPQYSKSTLSISPDNVASGYTLTYMTLTYYPTALCKVPPPAKPAPPPNSINIISFLLSQSMTWQTTSTLSNHASVYLDYNDHLLVSSVGTSTTAESLLTVAIVSRDWRPIPHSMTSAKMSTFSTQGGESPTSTPGVYYQCHHSRLLGDSVSTCGCTTSSLVNALNRFNIDSDYEASVASNSIVEDHMLIEDEENASFNVIAFCTSKCSHTSTGSTKSQQMLASRQCAGRNRKKKVGTKQCLMESDMAYEQDACQRYPFPTNKLSQLHVDIGIVVGNDNE